MGESAPEFPQRKADSPVLVRKTVFAIASKKERAVKIDVIVRPAVDPLHFFVPAPARRQNEHRREDARFPPAAKQGESIYFRQSEIEYYCVVVLSLREEIGLFPIGGAVDGVAGFGERFRQLPGQ